MIRILEWTIFGLLIAGIYVLAGPTTLGGPASYVIVDGRSMEPTYQHGDLVIAHERDTYAVGDIVVYDAPVDAQFNVIHRITERTEGGFITQGDNRDEVDGWIAPDDEIYGAALFHIPRGGAIVTFLRQPAAILALLAGWLTFLVMDRRRTPNASNEPARYNGPRTRAWSSHQEMAEEVQRRRRRASEPKMASSDRSWTPRTERRALERAARREKRSTATLLSLAVLVGGSGGIFLAHAAFLHVDAGVLQAHSVDADIDPPPPPEEDPFAITVEVRFFDSGKDGHEIGVSPVTFEPVDVPSGGSYEIAWNGPGNSSVVDCDSDSIQYPGDPPQSAASGVGTFTPEGDATHVLCVQTALGNVPENIDLVIINADDEHTEIELVEDNEVEGACEGGDSSEACRDASSDELDGADSQETEGLDVGGADDADDETTDGVDTERNSSDTDTAADEVDGSDDTGHEDGDDPDDANGETDDRGDRDNDEGGANEKDDAEHETEDNEDGDEDRDDRDGADNEDDDAGDGNDGDAR